MVEDVPKTSAHNRRRPWLLALLLVCLIGLLVARPDWRGPAAAITSQAIRTLVFDTLGVSPRRVYAGRLWLAGLYDAPLGQRWRHAVDRAEPRALKSRLNVQLSFAADTIDAQVYTADLKAGTALQWRLQRPDSTTGHLYATLERYENGEWHNVTTLDDDRSIQQFVIDSDGRYRLVFQPELAATVHAHLALVRGGSLPFPVVGGHTYDIGGGFGVARDGGARRHKGIDIFADRDTPVRAVADGRISTGQSGLGGHHIFLSAGMTGPRYYYAHLDHFVVDDGAAVSRGDIIGTVGNSGNARGGPTHLHFAIYTAGGAIDPAGYIKPMPTLPAD